jgi:flagella basal body P-ring formation protein FlgA
MKIYLNSKKNQAFILALIIVLFLQLPAAANTINSNDFKGIFQTLLQQNNSLQTAKTGQRQIVNFSSKPATLEVPSGVISYKTISQTGGRQQSHTASNQLGRQVVWLAVLVDGHEEARVKLTGDIQLFGDVVCLRRTKTRHSILSPDDIEIVRRSIGMLGPDFIADPQLAIGRELKTTLQPGAILYGRLLDNPTMVSRGSLVSILARSGALTIKAAGQIRTSGALGDIVQVKNLMSRKEIYARVISPSEVQVDF